MRNFGKTSEAKVIYVGQLEIPATKIIHGHDSLRNSFSSPLLDLLGVCNPRISLRNAGRCETNDGE